MSNINESENRPTISRSRFGDNARLHLGTSYVTLNLSPQGINLLLLRFTLGF